MDPDFHVPPGWTGSDPSHSIALEHLSANGLLPVRRPPDPHPAPVSQARRTASAEGAMVGTAVGDALGRPAEGRHPDALRRSAHAFADYQRWPGWRSGPAGTFTDDTQMTLCVAETLLACGGRLDPADLGRRFVEWLPEGRGKGRTCTDAVLALRSGEPWWSAGQSSAGNGAAMRVAPVGVALGHDPAALAHDAALSAVVTHADPMAVASAVAHAWLVARLAAVEPGHVDVDDLVTGTALAAATVDDPGAPERDWQDRPGKTSAPVRLADRLAEVGGLVGEPIGTVMPYLYNGAFVLESLPAALWCFLAHLDDPERGVLEAVLAGRDADTVASMTAAYFGALYGVGAFPARWIGAELEEGDRLRDVAARLVSGPAPA